MMSRATIPAAIGSEYQSATAPITGTAAASTSRISSVA